jgi:hypothetical protein
MFVDVIAVHVVQMAVMQIVEMTIMADCCVTAVGAMLVGMVWMVLLRAIGHAVRSSRPAGLMRERWGEAEAVARIKSRFPTYSRPRWASGHSRLTAPDKKTCHTH